MAFCGACQSIFSGCPPQPISRREDHHKTKDDFFRAVENHCLLCSAVSQDLTYRGRDRDALQDSDNTFTSYEMTDLGHGKLQIYVEVNNIFPQFFYRLYPSEEILLLSMQSIGYEHEIRGSTSSTQCFDLARSWMSTCLQRHQYCGNSATGKREPCEYYPTRLLDINPGRTDIEARLCITKKNPPATPYMTLSHCWGVAQCLKLDNTTFSHLEAGFKLAELPQCFRDATKITKELGIRYLWIDALCIFQDSEEDWSQEAASMMMVYENSYCNISALNAADSEQSCFYPRDISTLAPKIVETQWENRPSASYNLLAHSFESERTESLLNRRAWVLQERILSPRNLCYGKKQLIWECSDLTACETYPGGIPQDDVGQPRHHETFGRFRKTLGVEIDSPSDRRKRHMLGYKYWGSIVEDYSFGTLTRAEDKLVAISGLAKRIQRIVQDTYLAGLWKGNLLYDLLWFVSPDFRQIGYRYCPVRQSSYRAPTWSWASIDCNGGTVVIGFSYGRTDDEELHSPSNTLFPSFSAVEILASGVSLASADATGQVTYGFIHLRGRLLTAFLRLDRNEDGSDANVIVDLPGLEYAHAQLSPDLDLRTRCGQAGIFFLPILWLNKTQGLLLELNDPATNRYERLGRLWVDFDYFERHQGNVGLYQDPFGNEEHLLTLI